MATPRSTIRTNVIARVGNSDFSTDLINQFINDANREIINKRIWPFMRNTETQAIVEDDSSFTLGAGVQRIETLRITLPEDKERDITRFYLDPEDFDRKYPDLDNEATGTPRDWTLIDNTVQIAPYADGSYTFTVRYFALPTNLDEDTDNIDIPDDWQELLVLGVMKRVREYNDEYAEANVISNMFDEMLEDMLLRYYPEQQGRPIIMRSNRGGRSRSFFDGS